LSVFCKNVRRFILAIRLKNNELRKTLYQWFGPAPLNCIDELKKYAFFDRETTMVLLERLVQMTGTHWKKDSFENYPTSLQAKKIINFTPKIKLLNQFMFESAQYAHDENMSLELDNRREVRIIINGNFRKVSPNWNQVCKMWFDVLDAKPLDIRAALKLTEAESYAVKWNHLTKYSKTKGKEKLIQIIGEKSEKLDNLCNTILFLFRMLSKKTKIQQE